MFVKNRILQLVIGCLALVLAIVSALMLGGAIPSSIKPWAHTTLFICLFINLVEVVIYFLFAKTYVTKILCRWLNLFTICVMFVVLTFGFIQGASEMFNPFNVVDLFVVIANYALIATIIVFLVFSKKETQLMKNIEKEK